MIEDQVERVPLLNAEEQNVMDALAMLGRIITVDWGMTANQHELIAAIHVLQGFVAAHMLHRVAPDEWSDWRR